MNGSGLRRAVLLAAGLLMLLAGGTAGASARKPVTPSLTWGHPLYVGGVAPGYSVAGRGVDGVLGCVSTRLCVASDAAGHLVSSTDPGRPGSWRVDPSTPHGHYAEMSCPSVHLCLAVTTFDRLNISTDPARGPWHLASAFDAGNPIDSLTCPSVSLCVIGDEEGHVLSSTDPASGHFRQIQVASGGDTVGKISCPSVHFCAAVLPGIARTPGIAWSTDPAGGSSAWHVVRVPRFGTDGENAVSTISCPSASLCVVQPGTRSVYVSTDPTGPASSWRLAYRNHDQHGCADGGDGCSDLLAEITCPTVTRCVGFDQGGGLIESTNPAGGAGSWRFVGLISAAPTNAGVQGTGFGLACPSVTLCLVPAALPGRDSEPADVFATRTPTVAASWHPERIEAHPHRFSGLSCPTRTFCAGRTDTGLLLTTDDPAGDTAWRQTQLPAPLARVSCASASLCSGITEPGRLLISTRPQAGPHAWRTVALPVPVVDVACPTTRFCLAVGEHRQVFTSTQPTDGLWRETVVSAVPDLDPPRLLADSSLACLASGACVIGGHGEVAASTDPAGGSGYWHDTRLQAKGDLSVSCASLTVCLAVSPGDVYFGKRFASGDPFTGHPRWTERAGEAGFVSCTAGPLCVLVSAHTGENSSVPRTRLYTTTDPTTLRFARQSPEAAGPVVSAVSCPDPGFRVAVDSFGDRLIGRRRG